MLMMKIWLGCTHCKLFQSLKLWYVLLGETWMCNFKEQKLESTRVSNTPLVPC